MRKTTFSGAIVLAGMFLSPAMAQAQTQAQGPAPAATNPRYDPELAKRLGADDRGMRTYLMCFLKTGPLKVDDQARRAELMKGRE